jgi:carboxylesterase type B
MQAPRANTRASGISEDCLYANIWTPANQAGGKLPVIVWVYGGGMTGGSGPQTSFDGEAFAKKGMVLVTFNYRVGAFGFLAHPLLTNESPEKASGNYALMDQLAALRWVKTNIAALCGDPGRVTLAGESAGASCISAILTSPLAKGLFQRAILESPGAMRPLSSLAHAEKAGEIAGNDLAAMRGLSSKDVLALNERLTPAVRSLTKARALGPIVDGWVVKLGERKAYAEKRIETVPLLIGGNTDEGANFVRSWPIKTVEDFRGLARDNFGPEADKVVSVYGVRTDADVPYALKYLFADTQFNYGVRGVARAMSQLQPKTFRYHFSRRPNDRREDPVHASEIVYVFGNLSIDANIGAALAANRTDQAISSAMMAAWIQFAATGDPNGGRGDLPNWPRYSSSSESYMEFGDTIHVSSGVRNQFLDFVQDYLEQTNANWN